MSSETDLPDEAPECRHDPTYIREANEGTTAGPGSEQKIKILELRYYLGLPLFNPNDRVRSTGNDANYERDNATLGALLQLSEGMQLSEAPQDEDCFD